MSELMGYNGDATTKWNRRMMVVNNNPFFLNISGGTNTVYGHVDKVEIKNGRSDVDE